MLLGDYLHNVRSALDHLVCQLALLDGAPGCETTQFPITSSHGNYVSQEPRWLRGVSPGHRADLERLQPYHAGARMNDHLLMILDEFSNVDKHRVVHPAFGYFLGFEDVPHGFPNADAGTIRWNRIATGRRVRR